ncbi:unnamed protein product [Ceutorhynchus assimilis]|uniref:Uncharacterized protein n=1 Tax=Ceutorhynchus assimilis TaxID=467358 RepID=A0A9N9QIM1_9CUCU|nr:unnamed protein product [Ceutorhynchus assimilis]
MTITQNSVMNVETLKLLNNELNEKNAILKELNAELKENNVLLKNKLCEQPNQIQTPDYNYAYITTNGNPTIKENVPNIIIQANDRNINKLLTEAKKTICEKTNLPVNLNLVKDKVIVKCKNKADVETVELALKEDLSKEARVQVETKKSPRIKMVRYRKKTTTKAQWSPAEMMAAIEAVNLF